jgi:hypothetical protein
MHCPRWDKQPFTSSSFGVDNVNFNANQHL